MRQTVLPLLLLASTTWAEEPAFRATLDGRPIGVHLPHGPLLAGDLIEVDGVHVALGLGERRLDLVTEGGVLAVRRGDRVDPIAAAVAPGDPRLARLESLDAEARRALREVRIDRWDATVARLVADLDLARCVLVVENAGLVETPLPGDGPPAEEGVLRSLPPLPEGTRHLVLAVGWGRSRDRLDLSGLTRLSALEALDLQRGEQLDLALLRQLPRLRILRGLSSELRDLAPLAGLPALEALDLGFHKVEDLAPLAGARALVRLSLAMTNVRSLAPLAGLPRLQYVSALASRLDELAAEGFPALRHLDLMSTVVPAAHVAAFRAAHPGCEVLHGWMERFREVTRHVDRVCLRRGMTVRVREDGRCYRDPEDERVLRELTGDEARAFLARFSVLEEPPSEELARAAEAALRQYDRDGDGVITLDEVPEGYQRDRLPFDRAGRVDRPALDRETRRQFTSQFCKCTGSAVIELYRGPERVTALSLHHGQSVRWPAAFGDRHLSAGVGGWLTQLFQEAGVQMR